MLPQERNRRSTLVLISKIREFLKTLVKRLSLYRRIRFFDKLYGNLVANSAVLTKAQHKEIDAFWSNYYRIRHDSHRFYTEKTGRFDVRFIPDSIHTCIIDPFFNNWKSASIIDNKCYYPIIFPDVNLPRTVAFRLNGMWYSEYGCVVDFQHVVALVFAEKECFIKKATDSWGGLGVFYFCSEKETKESFYRIIESIPCDIVIQESIKQSEVLAAINQDSVNTIRVITLLSNTGEAKVYSGILRMGIKGAKVDNASSGGISVGIDAQGRLKSKAYSNTGVKYEKHPSSGIRFENYFIPNYKEVLAMVTSLHPRLPHFRLISWDVAIDSFNKPLLIEANLCDGELDFHQLNNGPLFGSDTEMILREVFGRHSQHK